MRRFAALGLALALSTSAVDAANAQRASAAPAPDMAPHKVSFITTTDGVRLEVLDYGGQGKPIVLISGYGETGHVFDTFAVRLAARHRVIALTRRAHGASSQPPLDPANYSLDRLVKDVVEVMDQMKIDRAALAGWSFGGAELSGVATHFPERVSALVYLDAAYAYAYYAPGNALPDASNIEIDLADLRDKLRAARLGSAEDAARLYGEVLTKSIAELEADIRAAADRRRELSQSVVGPPAPAWRLMMRNNLEKFGPIAGVPILAIFAILDAEPGLTPAERADEALGRKWLGEQISRYRAAHPAARIMEIEGAAHDVFNSHPEEVLREMESLLDAP